MRVGRVPAVHGHGKLLRRRHKVVAHVGRGAARPALEAAVHCMHLLLVLLEQVEVRLLLQMAVIDVFAMRHGGILMLLRRLLLLKLLAINHVLGRSRD